ncbi:MAG: oxidoreductase [Rhodospirillaceae bacterium]|nr:oxidoreductase [Rhodospirillaceae bacterium]HAA91250.1 NAD(P)-dependent oxidoreductase [Rhodospirillaceae bacterium]
MVSEGELSPVGMIGLGIMGSAMAANLLRAGFAVVGYDVSEEAIAALIETGGDKAASPHEVGAQCPVVITSLPSVAAFDEVLTGENGLIASSNDGLVVVDTSTLPLEAKQAGHDALAVAGITLLDCPLSGTGAQARTKDLVVLGSGDTAAFEKCLAVFEGFARAHHYLGPFGNGSKMKFVANHLVNVHNVAAAEAMVLGMKAGLDAQLIYEVIREGAGNSRIFELRTPMMVAGVYDEATMKIDVWQKDLDVIGDFANALECPIPLFDTAAKPYRKAMDQGLGAMDTAAVCEVLEKSAGLNRKNRG